MYRLVNSLRQAIDIAFGGFSESIVAECCSTSVQNARAPGRMALRAEKLGHNGRAGTGRPSASTYLYLDQIGL